MSAIIRQAGRLALYALVPVGSALAPLVVIPAVTARAGSAGWASVAVAMSIGLAGAVVAELGWTIVGPQRVARSRHEAVACYEEALASRLIGVAVLAPICVGLSLVLTVEHRAAAVLLSLGVLAGALSPGWFFVGLGRPGAVLWTETVPRMVLGLAAAGAITAGAPLATYGGALLVAALLTQLLAGRAGAVVWPSRGAFVAVPATVRSQGVVTIGRSVSAIYKALPAAILAATSPTSVALFSATDRPLRMGLQVLAAVPQRLQVWVGVTDPDLVRRRTRVSIGANAVLGVVAGAVFALTMPVVALVLFSGTVHVSGTIALVGGLLVATICVSRGLGLALVTAHQSDHTTTAAVVSACIGVPGIVVGGALAGAVGALAALVVAEVAGAVLQWALLSRTPRRIRAVGSTAA